MLNLDTHIVIEFLRGTLRKDDEQTMFGDSWSISAIVIWEIYNLAHLGKIELDVDASDFNRDLNRIHVWPITSHVCRQLRFLDFRSDPADEIIAATSLAHGIPLLTRDMRMLGSQVVPLAIAS